MSYEFSFSRRQWWGTIAGMVALLVLMFAAGFLGGALWQESRTNDRPAVPAPVVPAVPPVQAPAVPAPKSGA